MLINPTDVHKIGGYTRTGLIALLGGNTTHTFKSDISAYCEREKRAIAAEKKLAYEKIARINEIAFFVHASKTREEKLLLEIYPLRRISQLS